MCLFLKRLDIVFFIKLKIRKILQTVVLDEN